MMCILWILLTRYQMQSAPAIELALKLDHQCTRYERVLKADPENWDAHDKVLDAAERVIEASGLDMQFDEVCS